MEVAALNGDGGSFPFQAAADGDRASYGPTMVVDQDQLVRMAIIAAGVGARFEREGIAHDPMAWMLAPRNMFDGASALTACLESTGFERAIVLHAPGAGFGLDADPDLLDDLLEDDAEDVLVDQQQLLVDHELEAMPRHDPPRASRPANPRTKRGRSPQEPQSGQRLFSSSFVRYDAGGRVLVFVAAVVDSERTFRNRIFDRYGAIAALGASVRIGFDLYDGISSQLVSEHVADRLSLMSADPKSNTLEGFDVIMEQRS